MFDTFWVILVPDHPWKTFPPGFRARVLKGPMLAVASDFQSLPGSSKAEQMVTDLI
jgi:hypothetical protein